MRPQFKPRRLRVFGWSRGLRVVGPLQGQVDCVVCSHVLEHVHQPLHMLELLLASLKPQGVLLLSVPNAASFCATSTVRTGVAWRPPAPSHPGRCLADGTPARPGF
ncbi:class I SAM-dependent methyltransferase [Rhodoferax sp. AJA081-3]|uniref:class I SAM-dependent methyltransferase n=1 Tax=Rhodoferax sp. AJA081-3 TaxID=2752316 RepID=UPI0035304BAC